MLIRIGAYIKGSDSELDEAINKKDNMEKFLSQNSSIQNPLADTIANLLTVMNQDSL
jgi:flagellum-specific ATP synthase